MDGLIFFLFIFGLIWFMQGKTAKAKSNKSSLDNIQRKLDSWTQSQDLENLRLARQSQPNFGQKKSGRGNASSSGGTWTRRMSERQMAYRAAKHGMDALDGADTIRDPNDKNRNRRADWGSREGDGVFSMRNTIYMITGFMIFLWILSTIPA